MAGTCPSYLSTRIRKLGCTVPFQSIRLQPLRPNLRGNRTVRLRIASGWASSPSQVTPHPARSGWSRRRQRATLSPRERVVLETHRIAALSFGERVALSLALRHPGGRGSEASAEMVDTMRFLTGRSRRFSSRSAREVMLTLNINFASRAPFLHHIFKRPAGLTFAFTRCTAHR